MIYFGKVDIMSKCIGCGAILQDKSPLDEGYTNDLTHKYCIRCFNIKNYNKYLKVSNKDYTDSIKKIDSKNDLILYVTDFLLRSFIYLIELSYRKKGGKNEF